MALQLTGVYHLVGKIQKPGFALRVLHDLADALDLTLLRSLTCVYPRREGRPKKEPLGITAIVVLAESHISLSTYPEDGSVVVTFAVCRGVNTEKIEEVLQRHHLTTSLERGPQWLR